MERLCRFEVTGGRVRREFGRLFVRTTLRTLGSDSNSDWHSYLLDVRRMPLTPPKVERATKTGMMKANLPYRRSAKVWKRMEMN